MGNSKIMEGIMSNYQNIKLLTLVALAVVTSMAATTSYAAGLGAYGGPRGGQTLADANALREWQSETIANDKMRQRMSLPPSGEPTTTATKAQAAGQEGDLKQWQDSTVKNNTMRNRMGLSQQ
jgi:hypothetical protein